MVYAADFYVIPVKKCCTCKSTLYEERWCDNGDGTVTDLTTCLVWLKYAGGWRKPWLSSSDYNDAHMAAGILKDGSIIHVIPEIPLFIYLTDGSVQGDWRVPTKTELEGLVNGSPPITCLPGPCDVYCFKDVQATFYWSSTTPSLSLDHACLVDVRFNDVYYDLKSRSNYVWPVRNPK